MHLLFSEWLRAKENVTAKALCAGRSSRWVIGLNDGSVNFMDMERLAIKIEDVWNNRPPLNAVTIAYGEEEDEVEQYVVVAWKGKAEISGHDIKTSYVLFF